METPELDDLEDLRRKIAANAELIAANDKKIAENAETLARQMAELRRPAEAAFEKAKARRDALEEAAKMCEEWSVYEGEDGEWSFAMAEGLVLELAEAIRARIDRP